MWTLKRSERAGDATNSAEATNEPALSVLGLQHLADLRLSEAQAALENQTSRLAMSLSLLTATLESTPDGISVDDLSGKLILYNSRFSLMWRLPSDLLDRGSSAEVAAHVSSKLTRESVVSIMDKPFAFADQWETRDIVELVDGRLFERHVSAHRIADAVAGTVTSWRDVTDREGSIGMVRARDAAERANQAKSDFIGRMSHELRTPLNAVLGFSEILRMDPREPLSATQKRRVSQIHTAGSHLLMLIDDLLDVARLDAGNLRISVERVNATETLQEAVSDLAARAGALGVELSFDREGASPHYVEGDRIRLKQVLHNLLSNAVKYNRPGGSVRASIAARGLTTEIVVGDTGLGMDANQLSRLFRPFDRLGREGSAVDGAGIGLVIARNYAELMGGKLGATSSAGVGSRFVIELKSCNDEEGGEEVDKPVRPLEILPAPLGLVLYIEDDEVNRLLMRAYFDVLGDLPLDMAIDGMSGVAAAARLRPTLILIDLMLPDISGFDVLQAIRDDPATSRTPCVAVSARALPVEIAQALQAGFDGYLTKPLTLTALTQELARLALGKSQAATPIVDGVAT